MSTPETPDTRWPPRRQESDPQPPASPPPGLTSPVSPDQEPGWPERPRDSRKGLIVGLSVGGGVLALLFFAGVLTLVIGSALHTPQRVAATYLHDLAEGNATAALRLSGTTVKPDDLLLTDVAYRSASNRISGYRIDATDTVGDGAAVTATVRQAGKTIQQSFQLVKSGRDMLVFDRWSLRPITLGAVTVSVRAPDDTKLMVGKEYTSAVDGVVTLRALPGDYPVALADPGTWFTATNTTAEVRGFGAAGAAHVAVIRATLTDKGRASATTAVNGYIDACAASKDLAPSGCSFSTVFDDPTYSISNQKWTISPRPTFTVGTFDVSGGGWRVTTKTPGSASFSARITATDGRHGNGTAGPIPVETDGTITFESSGAVFEPAAYLGVIGAPSGGGAES